MSELDDKDLEIVAKLRALPPEGVEPDWQKLEAAIRAEVGDEAPRPWWRNWRWIVPIWALATTAVVAFLIMGREHSVEKTFVPPTPVMSKHVEPANSGDGSVANSVEPSTEAPAMWLDGEAVDLESVDDSFDPLDDSARAALDTEEPDDNFDLHWLDQLDDRAMDSVEQWLMHKRS